jgi:hypothetical protein
MKRFVIGTNRTTAEQDAAFLNILRTRWPHLGWWHQLSETWLIIDLSGQVTTNALRDAAMEAFPGIYIMVVEAARQWHAFGRTSDFKWMDEQWGPER